MKVAQVCVGTLGVRDTVDGCYIATAYMIMALYSYGLYSYVYGLYSYSYGLYSYIGSNSYGVYSYGP